MAYHYGFRYFYDQNVFRVDSQSTLKQNATLQLISYVISECKIGLKSTFSTDFPCSYLASNVVNCMLVNNLFFFFWK